MKARGWLLCASLLLAGVAARADDWAQLGGGPDRAGRSGERLSPDGARAWRADTGGETHAGVVVADGVVVVAAADGTVRALYEADGAPRWSRSLGGADLDATPAAGQGRVVVALGDGRVVCLALDTGATLWERGQVGGPRAAVAVADGVALVSLGFPSRSLVCLELDGGATRWQVELPQLGYAPPAVADDLVVVGTDDGAYQARRLSDGAHVWTFATQGRVLLSGPALGGGGALLLPGGKDPHLYRVDVDDGAWPGANRTVALADPSPPPSWSILGYALSTSTPAWSGARVVAVVRHDYVLDEVEPWWVADRYLVKEQVVSIDSATATVAWTVSLGEARGPTPEAIPPLGVCPAPALFNDGAAAWVACASSLAAKVRFLRLSDGGAGGEVDVTGERWGRAASPAVANGRLLLVTADGAVEARSLGNAPPAAPAPQGGGQRFDVERPRLAWTPAQDPDHDAGSLVYEVRVDDDGEVLLDALVSATSPAGAVELEVPQALPSDRDYTWRARARDPDGAWSPWSAPALFEVALVPEPVRALRASSGRDWVEATWTPSASDFAAAAAVWIQPTGGQETFVGVTTSTSMRMDGLAPEAEYTVRVVARSSRGVDSVPEVVVVRTGDRVVLDGAPRAGLTEALGAAGPGSVLTLGPGDFQLPGAWALPDGFTLRGAGAHLTRLVLPPGSAGLTVGAGRTTIGSLALLGAGPAVGQRGLVAEQGELRLDHVVLARLATGLRVGGAADAQADFVTIVRNACGVEVDGGTLRLGHAVVTRNEAGVHWAGGALEARYSVVTINDRDRDWTGARPSNDEGLLPLFATFRDEALDDWREAWGAATIDRGDPAVPVGDEPAPNGGRVNLGAFGQTSEAAPTPAVVSSSSGGGCALSRPADAGASALPLALLAALGGLLLLARPSRLAAR